MNDGLGRQAIGCRRCRARDEVQLRRDCRVATDAGEVLAWRGLVDWTSVFAPGTIGGPTKTTQAYDCFPFFKELDILEIRLRELWDLTDKFVLVDALKDRELSEIPIRCFGSSCRDISSRKDILTSDTR